MYLYTLTIFLGEFINYQPQRVKTEIKYEEINYLNHLRSETQIEYLRNKSSDMIDTLNQIRNEELIVSGFQKIVEMLIQLTETTKATIYVLNQRHEMFGAIKTDHLQFVLRDYIKANSIAITKGVKITRIFVIPNDKLEEDKAKELYKKHKELGVHVVLVIKEKLQQNKIYLEMAEKFNKKGFDIKFKDTTFVLCDEKLMEHTLVYSSDSS